MLKEFVNDEKWRGRSLELERASVGNDQSRFGAGGTGGGEGGKLPPPREEVTPLVPRFAQD